MGAAGLQCPPAVGGLLQQGFLATAGQGPVLLGIGGPGEGLEPGAGAAAKDYGGDPRGARNLQLWGWLPRVHKFVPTGVHFSRLGGEPYVNHESKDQTGP